MVRQLPFKKQPRGGLPIATALVILIGILLTGHVLAAPQSRDPLSGAWYTGDGLGVNITIHFRPDGSYSADWFGCMGRYGRAAGSWTLTASVVELTPTLEEDMLKGFLRRLEVESAEEPKHLFRLVLASDGAWTRGDGEPFDRRPDLDNVVPRDW